MSSSSSTPAFDRNGDQHGIVVLDTGNSVLRSVWILGAALRNQIMKADPQPGDRLLIQYGGKVRSKASGREYADFKVTSDRQRSTWWDQQRSHSDDDDTDFPSEPSPFSDDAPVLAPRHWRPVPLATGTGRRRNSMSQAIRRRDLPGNMPRCSKRPRSRRTWRAPGVTSAWTLRDGWRARASSGYQRRVPGLLIPLHRADGSVWGYQYRPDSPRVTRAGTVIKYETPSGQHNVDRLPARRQGRHRRSAGAVARHRRIEESGRCRVRTGWRASRCRAYGGGAALTSTAASSR